MRRILPIAIFVLISSTIITLGGNVVAIKFSGKGHPIYIGNQAFTTKGVQEWLDTNLEKFGGGEQLWIDCDKATAFGELLDFLNSIKASRWQVVKIRGASKPSSNEDATEVSLTLWNNLQSCHSSHPSELIFKPTNGNRK